MTLGGCRTISAPAFAAPPYFFSVSLAERGSDLLVREVGRLRESEGDADFSTRWGAIKGRFSRGLRAGRMRSSHAARREKAVWQRRFWEHHIRGGADFAAHVRYCWENPVKHGFVERPEDWPYSSVHRDIRLGRSGV